MRNRRARGGRPAAGFTLLEIVLAMTALALVSAICYGAFHLGVRAVERGEVAVVNAQRLRVAADVMIRQIKSVVPYVTRDRDENIYPFFFGDATSMAFVTASGMEGGGGLVRVVYRVEGDPPRLVMSESVFFSPDRLGREFSTDRLGSSDTNQTGERTAVLLEGFRSLKFEYMEADSEDDPWRPQWNPVESETLPAAVRVRIDGIPGLDTETWGQEIPIMSCHYGDNGCELSEDDESRVEEEDANEDEDEDEATPTPGAGTGSRGSRSNGDDE